MITLFDEISKSISLLSSMDLENNFYDRCHDVSNIRILKILNSISYWCLSKEELKKFKQLVDFNTLNCGKEEQDVLKTDPEKLIEFYKKYQECSPLEKYEMVNNNFKIKYRPIITVTKNR